MSLVTLLPFIVLIGAMFLMTRSAKRKQSQAAQMRDQMQPGSGVRTIGGMYATVKEVHEDSVLLEVAPGTHAIFAKNAIGTVLDDAEYNRIVHGSEDPLGLDGPIVPDDASSLTDDHVDLDKSEPAVDLGKKDTEPEDAAPEPGTDASGKAAGAKGEDAAEKPAADKAEADDAPSAEADEAGATKAEGDTGAK
ncbi:preprotein translocase subunit YajC [Streptomyces sp. NPDC050560]|uniref:preprotein translocase subunit YajC n=1 Tax=Streptomyces sp. NPDC050560 TaxID=3365630 RepID=UPI003787B533